MRWLSALLFALSLAALNAAAGEDSTHKWHCTGANFYEPAKISTWRCRTATRRHASQSTFAPTALTISP